MTMVPWDGDSDLAKIAWSGGFTETDFSGKVGTIRFTSQLDRFSRDLLARDPQAWTRQSVSFETPEDTGGFHPRCYLLIRPVPVTRARSPTTSPFVLSAHVAFGIPLSAGTVTSKRKRSGSVPEDRVETFTRTRDEALRQLIAMHAEDSLPMSTIVRYAALDAAATIAVDILKLPELKRATTFWVCDDAVMRKLVTRFGWMQACKLLPQAKAALRYARFGEQRFNTVMGMLQAAPATNAVAPRTAPRAVPDKPDSAAATTDGDVDDVPSG